MDKLSIIIPVYWNEDTLRLLYEDLKEKVLPKLPEYEIVFVDDGSGDSSWKIYTDDAPALPQYIGPDASVENAYITQGVVVDGEVKNSVLFTNAAVAAGAKVIDSVLMPGAVVKAGATVVRALVADGVEISEGAAVGNADSEEITLVAKNV